MVGLAPFSGKKKKGRCVTLAFASHLLSPTMSDSEIGGEPAIIKKAYEKIKENQDEKVLLAHKADDLVVF